MTNSKSKPLVKVNNVSQIHVKLISLHIYISQQPWDSLTVKKYRTH